MPEIFENRHNPICKSHLCRMITCASYANQRAWLQSRKTILHRVLNQEHDLPVISHHTPPPPANGPQITADMQQPTLRLRTGVKAAVSEPPPSAGNACHARPCHGPLLTQSPPKLHAPTAGKQCASFHRPSGACLHGWRCCHHPSLIPGAAEHQLRHAKPRHITAARSCFRV